MKGEPNAKFIDPGTAPEFFAHGLHDVEVTGSVSRFILFVFRKTPAGILYREPAFTCIMPNETIGDAVAMTMRKLGTAIVVPAIAVAARELVRTH